MHKTPQENEAIEQDTSKLKTSSTLNSKKYTPPHRRNQAQPQSSYTTHGRSRKEQRGISDNSVVQTLEDGISLSHANSSTFIDETTQVITAADGKIITVLDNKRNSRFDILKITKNKEALLLTQANNNNDAAMCELAELYLSGKLGNREIQKAHFWLLRAANKHGNSHAMCLLSDMYQSNDLGKPNSKLATEWLEKAAQRNNRYALAILGQRNLVHFMEIKDDNNVLTEDKISLKNKVLNYLQRAADMGATRAIWQLGEIAEKGWFDPPNLLIAKQKYIEAARLGSPSALGSLQRLCLAGIVSEQHFEHLLNTASNLIAKTSSDLAVDLGLKQIEGKLGKNIDRGFILLEEAAKKNNPKALKALAKCYEKGIGCKSNLLLSQKWYIKLKELYQKAASQTNIEALWSLSQLYLSGKLGAIDYEQAEHCLITATLSHDIASFLKLGTLYLEGSLGDKDPKSGIAWIQKAIALLEERAAGGDLKAIHKLISIYLNKDLGCKDYQAALRCLNLLIAKQHGGAMLLLAKLHLKGKFSGVNLEEALKYLLMAKDLADIELSHKVLDEIDKILGIKSWNTQQKQLIIANMLRIGYETKVEKPFRIGRILGDIFSQGILIEPDFLVAAFWYEKAGDCENSTALLKLGHLHETNVFEAKDFTLSKAIEYYIRAANIGNSIAKEKLLSLNNVSSTLEQESRETLGSWVEKHYKSETKHKTPSSSNEINLIPNANPQIENQKPEPKLRIEQLFQKALEQKQSDPHAASSTLKKLSKYGHKEASFQLAELYASGQLGVQVRPVALLFYKKAAKLKHPEAMKKLLLNYTSGSIIPPDLVKADKWRNRILASKLK